MTAVGDQDRAEAVRAAVEHAYEQDWTDGLPVVPATREVVAEFLATTSRDPEEVLTRMDHLGRQVTVELLAVNAAMAGCRPEYFPVVLAAWQAVMRERAAAGGGWQSTSGPAPLIVVNGPVAGRLGINGAGGVFGPGFRANATIARALGLTVRNALGFHPHVLEQATQGLPGRWTMCIAENTAENPWDPCCVDGGLDAGADAVSATLLRTSEVVDNRHTSDPEKLLGDFADTISRTGPWIFTRASVGVVFCPEHAQLLAGAGMSKRDVRGWLAERCGKSIAELERAGKDGLGDKGVRHASDPENRPDEAFERVLPSAAPQHLLIAVAGAANAGISMVVRQFGLWSATSVPVERQGAAQ
ncbi:hypothetical protein F4561_002031 [Lipingzhangella halophila]|uniref:Uncharacterized protein n=1 Tax=Lipingzhangella halophila TaxID=1783352 RepID=A0A7W7RGW5_9ACTN|nr:hypothetical protein [Lipingzhangella halophila]MBB4931211.1 hypothetical protein [Lipingzhangella halophila]